MEINIDGVVTYLPIVSALLPDEKQLITGELGFNNTQCLIQYHSLTAAGSYGAEIIDAAHLIRAPSTAGEVSWRCAEDCEFATNITELGAIGEKIIGSIEGVGSFTDSLQQIIQLPYSVYFEIIRDE